MRWIWAGPRTRVVNRKSRQDLISLSRLLCCSSQNYEWFVIYRLNHEFKPHPHGSQHLHPSGSPPCKHSAPLTHPLGKASFLHGLQLPERTAVALLVKHALHLITPSKRPTPPFLPTPERFRNRKSDTLFFCFEHFWTSLCSLVTEEWPYLQ